ncbi:MAG TPA: hypothetical protein VKM55_07575 [Candidatus Lokiarchaeia archaeon]|nr:hypothetical protein [Candidatus Lokiarchaeia archaeon]
MTPGDKDSKKNATDLVDLLDNMEKSKPLDELLTQVMDKELQDQFKKKEEIKNRALGELASASKIYEKMPLERLAIKLGYDMNDILDLLEQIIMNNEFTGIVISGKEIIFNKIQRKEELDQKPLLVISNTTQTSIPMKPPEIRIEPLKRKKVDLKFKVLTEEPVEQVPVEPDSLVAEAEVTPVAAQIQVKLNLLNNSQKSIDNVLVKFLVQGNARFLRMKPAYALFPQWNNEIIVPSIPPSSSRRILLFFTPLSCDPVEFNILVQHADAGGNFFDESLVEKIDICTASFARKPEITKEEFQALITRQLKFKGIRSYGIPSSLEPADAYLIMKEILLTNEFEFVGEKFIEEKSQFLGWYYTSFNENDAVQDFIVIGQVLNGKMEFFAMANEASQLLSGLTCLASQLRTALIERGTITDESELMELLCPSCGGVLDKFPTQGELHACKFCGAKLQF